MGALRFARSWGYWRPVVARVVEKYLACGILKHGFARVRCGSCKHEFLLAFSCKCRYFCPSCHAKRLALWGIWLEETLLAERDLSVGIVSSIQTHGSLSNWHPHLHMLVTDGGFRPDRGQRRTAPTRPRPHSLPKRQRRGS